MPYVPVSLPYGGINIDSGYSTLPAGFTSDCINILPFDPYKGKLRLGQRRALCGALEFNDTTPTEITREVQAIFRADAYVNGTLIQRCFIIAGGEVFVFDPGGSPTKLARTGLSAMKDSGHIGHAVFGQYAYFADGTYYRKVDITAITPTVVNWEHASGPYQNVRVSNGSGGYNYSPLLVRFGGRLAMGGIVGAPNVWFLSKLNDADIWNPTAASNNHDAVAGTNSTRFAVPGEPITALVPVGESGLLMAGSHTMTYLTADPIITDARFIELSRSVGIVSARAWCASDAQTIYVMAQDGLYRVQPNDFQITKSSRITTARLDTYFQQQKFDQLNCVLGYDAESQNVYCMMSRTDLPGSSIHLVYSQATNSFWPIKTAWPAFQAPTCCGDFPFGDARAPILAFGSTNGYLGWFDRDLTSGIDGQNAVGFKGSSIAAPTVEEAANQRVVSKLLMGPVLSQEVAQVMVKDVRIELTMDQPAELDEYQPVVSGPFLYALSGQTAEEAVGENIISVSVQFDPDYPMLTLDCGSASFTETSTQNCGNAANNSPAGAYGIDLFGAVQFAPAIFTTADALITDPTDRTYDYQSLEVYNAGAGSSNNWIIRDTVPPTYKTLMKRDETLPDTSADTPGGTYLYFPTSFDTPLNLVLPPEFVVPRVKVSSATYENTNSTLLGTLTYGRNDSQRCRINDQAVYMRIESLGVPWAIERMSVLVEATKFNRNVKGTY
jgi:hypothetical protein